MRILFVLWCTMGALASTAMEMPSLCGVFNRNIYDIPDLATDASAEHIIERFRENKREQLRARIVADLEERAGELESTHDARCQRLFNGQLGTLFALIPTLYFAKHATPVVMAGGQAFTMLYAGRGIDTGLLKELKQKIACYLSAIQAEDIALIEERYVVEKYQRPIAIDLACRIESVMLASRGPVKLSFDPHEFVADALRLPHRQKQFVDTVKLANCSDLSEDNRRDMNNIMARICSQSRLDAEDLNLRTCFIVFDDQSPKSDAYPKRLAHALGLPCVDLNIEDITENLCGTCCFDNSPREGTLGTTFSKNDGMVSNALVLINLNHLAQKTDEPISFIQHLLADKKLRSRFFGCMMDLSRVNFVIHLDNVADSFREDFLALYDDMPAIEVTNFNEETKRALLAHYATKHQLFRDEDAHHAIDVAMTQFSKRKVKHLFAILERMDAAPREEWPELLGLTAKVADLRETKSALQETCMQLRAQIKELDLTLTPLLKESLKRKISFTVNNIDDKTLTLQLDNGLVLLLRQSPETKRDEELRRWQQGDDVVISYINWGFHLTNTQRNACLPFAMSEKPRSDYASYETFVEHHGSTITTQTTSTTRQFDVSAWDNSYVNAWKKGDVLLVGGNNSLFYWMTSSKRLLLINLDRLDTESNFVRVNLLQ